MAKKTFENNEKYYHREPRNELEKNNFLQLNGAGIVLKDPEYIHKKEKSKILFEYIIEGEGFIDYDGEHYEVKNGDCILLNYDANEQKELIYGSSKDKPYLKIWFAANGKFIESMLKAFSITEAVTIVKCNVLEVFQNFVLPLPKNGFDVLTAMLAIENILCIMTNVINPNEMVANDFDALVDIYIKNNLRYMPALSVIAEDIGMDPKKFAAYFKQRFKENYKHYMRKQRLAAAKRMLTDTNLSISEISTYLGFCDQSYFSNCFRKEFNIYPNKYRQQKQK